MLSRNTKKQFYTCRTWSLTQNGLPSLSVTRVTTHSKQKVSDNTLKKGEHYSSRKLSTIAQKQITIRSRKIKLGEQREVRLSLNNDLAN
jgi:hypothetical protein